jgi:2-polyprenyl-6-methoxyphenol hydroxylase-like FAD-dependent oxidoreductase
MARVLVVGGAVCGLSAAILLARDGNEVIVLERDPEPAPESPEQAWERWRRDGIAQFRQAHYLQPRARLLLDSELPDVSDALASAGALRFDVLGLMPPAIADREPRPGDDRFTTLTARRSTVEQVLARAAAREPGVSLRHGVAVDRLVSGASAATGRPHVAGVRTAAGETIRADLVVDAMGRRSCLPAWLRELGAPPPHEEAEDSGFMYYTRFFQSTNGSTPQPRAPLLSPIGSFSVLTLPADSGTWSVTLYASAGDRAMKSLRHPERWDAVVKACPFHAHWLDGEPITGVLPIAGVVDRVRRLRHEDAPVATGVVAIGDAWACTNPSLGRGIALGLLHAVRLRDVARSHLGDPAALAEAWDAVTEAELTPWYRATVAVDRQRLAEIDALREGREPPAPDDPVSRVRAALPAAMRLDPDVFRAGYEIVACLTIPQDVFARPGLAGRVLDLASTATMPALGPDRGELLRLVA